MMACTGGILPLILNLSPMPWLLQPWYALNVARGVTQQVQTFCRRVNLVMPVKNTSTHHPAHSLNTNPTTLKLRNTCQVHSWILYFPVYRTLYLHKLRFTYSESGVDENPYHSKDSNQQIVTISSRLPVSPWSESNIFHYNFNHKH